MFMLVNEEVTNLKCQIGISSSGWGGRRKPIMAFTEQGALMVANVRGDCSRQGRKGREGHFEMRNSEIGNWPSVAPNLADSGGAMEGSALLEEAKNENGMDLN
jgi:hypothetical protein